MSTRILVLTTTLLICADGFAQTEEPASRGAPTVYKCTGANGAVIFSDTPCSGTGKAQKVDTSAALRTGSGGNNREIAANVADSDCRQRARQSAYGADAAKVDESNRHIADYLQRQKELAAQKVYAADGSGALVDDPGARQEISRLDAAIGTERKFQQDLQKSSGATYDTALKACEAQAAKAVQSAAKP